MTKPKTDMKSSVPLRRQTMSSKNPSPKTPEVPAVVLSPPEPMGHTTETMEILKTFDQYDFVRVCALPIIDLGISNPADMWAKDFNDLATRCRSEIIDENGQVKSKWIGVCNYLQDSTPIMTPEILAVSICKIAGWKAFLRDVDGKVD